MKVLFIGDIHIKFNNLKEINIILNILSEETFHVDFIVLAGDVLDTFERIQTQLLNKAFDLIHILRKKAPTYILIGNHDFIDKSQFCSHNHWLYGLKDFEKGNQFKIVDHPIRVNNTIFTPYIPNGRFKEALDQYVAGWESADCIFAHQEIKGCQMGAFISVDGDEWDESLPLIISGHIHEPQQHMKNVVYPGSVISHSYTYTTQGLIIFDIKGRKIVKKIMYDLGIENKKILYLSITKCNKMNEDNKLILKPNIKYSLEGTIPEITVFKDSQLFQKINKTCKIVLREATITGDSFDSIDLVDHKPFSEILDEEIKTNHESLIDDYYIIRK